MSMFLVFLLALLAFQKPPFGKAAMLPDIDPAIHNTLFDRGLPDWIRLGHGRTTPQIVWGCLSTIFACTWVAVHPNLSGPRDSGFQRWRRRVMIMLIAILAPELMVMWAMRQRYAAGKIKKMFNEEFYGGDNPDVSIIQGIREWFTGPDENPRKGWTRAHGFFVQMGGFMAYHDGKPVRVLTFKRLVESIRKREIDISTIQEEDITDKSKGDFLTKLVVVGQTTWFTVQCVARWRSGLPLAELEVLTLGFAVLNGIVYVIWWDKPQGVMVPIKLPLRSPPPVPLAEGSDQNAPVAICSAQSTTRTATPDDGMSNNSSDTEAALPSTDNATPPGVDAGVEDKKLLDEGDEKDKTSCHTFIERCQRVKKLWKDVDGFVETLLFLVIVPFYWISSVLEPLWKSSGTQRQPCQLNEIHASLLRPLLGPLLKLSRTLHLSERITVGRTRVAMFYAEELGENMETTFKVAPVAVTIGAIFGGVHLVLWSSSFRDPVVQWLWRGSALFITAEPIIVLFLLLFALMGAGLFAAIAYGLSGILYSVARCILIFLAFYTLSSLPDDVYRDIAWLDLLPHVR